MKASEIIKRLEELRAEHGDCVVRFLNDDHDWFIPTSVSHVANCVFLVSTFGVDSGVSGTSTAPM